MEVSTQTSQPLDISNSATFYMSSIIGALGLIGNAFVCLVMLRYRSIFNSTTNTLIIHQSVVDFLGSFVFLLRLLLIIPPTSQVPDNTLGSLYCTLWFSTWPQYSIFTVSTYNLVAISVERYFAMCQPVRHRNSFSNRLVKMIMVAAWICGWISRSYALPTTHNINGVCKIIWPSSIVQIVSFFIGYTMVILIPLGVIIFSYTKIILELRKRSKARVGNNNQDARNILTRANINVIKTLLVVAIFFVICWTPSAVINALYNLGLIDNFVNPTFDAIVVLNLCVNPFIYCFTYERFQKQVKVMLCGGRQRNDNRVDTINDNRVDTINDNRVDTINDNRVDTINDNRVDTINDNRVDTINDNRVDTMNDNRVDTINDNRVDTINDNLVDTINDKPVDTMNDNCVDTIIGNRVENINEGTSQEDVQHTV